MEEIERDVKASTPLQKSYEKNKEKKDGVVKTKRGTHNNLNAKKTKKTIVGFRSGFLPSFELRLLVPLGCLV
ncbi:hypothetical protein TSUD_321260 [Trifolium subterraneum]|uniref:Uncharacterized protein n=1 Tax=Trifolium subterraneum TaxID=3900 RepID=A0A2Z6ND64_TRISU|nr:hypothetical protein TSUD_321260 [Trifolium subterraneum]